MKKSACPKTRTSAIAATIEFSTENPKHLRILHALLTRPCPREQIDEVAGVSNGPDCIYRLRLRGLDIPCTRVARQDIDGEWSHPGIYWLTPSDRRVIRLFLARRERKGWA